MNTKDTLKTYIVDFSPDFWFLRTHKRALAKSGYSELTTIAQVAKECGAEEIRWTGRWNGFHFPLVAFRATPEVVAQIASRAPKFINIDSD